MMPRPRTARCAFPGCTCKLDGCSALLRCHHCCDRAFCSAHRLPEDHACPGYTGMVAGMKARLRQALEAQAGAEAALSDVHRRSGNPGRGP